MTALTGGCLCSAVRYTISEPPLGSRTCWCRVCQYLAAGSPTVNGFFKADAVTIGGPITYFDSIAESGNQIRRGFCTTCGTPVSSAALARPHLIAIRVGTLDDPGAVAPQQIIWTSQAPAWACLDPDLPRDERQPPPVA